MTNLSLILEVIRTTAVVITAVGVVWLCARLDAAARLFLAHADRAEADTVAAVTVADALLRIEEAAEKARDASLLVAARVDVTAELGFQAAASARRIESHESQVAEDLAGSIARADALPKDGNYGAAADAALRSADEQEQAGRSAAEPCDPTEQTCR